WRDGEDVIDGCRLVWEIGRYLWKRPPKSRPGAPPPDDADDASAGGAHAPAALRYGIMARLAAPQPPPEPALPAPAGPHPWGWPQIPQRAAEEETVWSLEDT